MVYYSYYISQWYTCSTSSSWRNISSRCNSCRRSSSHSESRSFSSVLSFASHSISKFACNNRHKIGKPAWFSRKRKHSLLNFYKLKYYVLNLDILMICDCMASWKCTTKCNLIHNSKFKTTLKWMQSITVLLFFNN